MTLSTLAIDIHLRPEDILLRMKEEVARTLQRPLREIPPKYFYDEAGSELFERITRLPEYYLTRIEHRILLECAPRIARGHHFVEVLELGSGSSTKTRILLDALRDAGSLESYLPVDVNEGLLRQTAERLVSEYPDLNVHGVVADFAHQMSCLPPARGRRLIAFLGSTIGNFAPEDGDRFLGELAARLQPGDGFLLGTDLVKDRSILEAAYNDQAGMTAEFNRNILRVLNRHLGANFVPSAFEHVAFFDLDHSWIEMRLRTLRRQSVDLPAIALELELPAGEEIRTEISCKYTPETVETMLSAAGLELMGWYADPHETFALSLSLKR